MVSKPSRQVKRARRASSFSAPRRQRGAAAIFGAVAILAALIALLLGVNVGMLYFSQRDLQREATVAALAGVQGASGCRGAPSGTPGSLAAVTQRVKTALDTNEAGADAFLTGIGGAGGPPAVQLGQTTYNGSTVYGFTPLAAGDPLIDSVRVNLSRAVPTPLGTMFGGNLTTLYASATAWQPAFGSFSVGTGLATLNTGSSDLIGPLLQGLLHTNASISLVNYNGLAQAQVSLAGLEAAAKVTNLNQLLSLQTNLTGALNIVGQAVSGTASGFISGLAGDAYNVSGSGSQPTQAYFGDLFNTAGGNFNPLVTDVASSVPVIDAADLLTALGEDASQGQTIALQPGSSFLNLLTLPVASLQTYVTIIQPPQFALGPALPTTTAQTAQVTLKVRATVNLSVLLAINAGADLNLASATATLTSLQCPGDPTLPTHNQNPSATIDVTTNLANLTVGSFNPSASSEPLGGGSLLTVLSGLATIKLTNPTAPVVKVGTAASQSTGPYDTYTAVQGLTTSAGNDFVNETVFTAAPSDNTYTVQSSDVVGSTINTALTNLTASNNLQVCVLVCLPLGSVVSGLASTLLSVSGDLDTVLQALEQALGLSLGTATVTMQGATIGEPLLTTTCLPIATTVPKGSPPPVGICPSFVTYQ